MITPENPATRKVLLIGWDAADWKIMHPLIDAGQMPFLEKFIDNGVMGNLATLQPILSPMIWTSIATGKRPAKHGIYGFTEPLPSGDGIRPVTSTSRTTRAIWNMLTQQGMKTHHVGWFASHPAEPINGVSVSNMFAPAVAKYGEPWPLPPKTIHPPELAEQLAEFRIHPQELDAGALLGFVPHAAEIDQQKDRRLAMLAKLLAECFSYHAATTWIMANQQWDFMTVYLDTIDHICHGFMEYHPPQMANVSDADFRMYKDVVVGAYRMHDMLLGTLLEYAGDDTTVIICSDHGYQSDHLRPGFTPRVPAGPAVWHRPYGMIAMQGPGIKKDETVFGASVLDITPTILRLLGLPLGEDMDGRALVSAFDFEASTETIPSWDTVGTDAEAGMHPRDQRQDPFAEREMLQQLIDLGYVEDPGENQQQAAAGTDQESRFNLARSEIQAGSMQTAIELLEGLVREVPDATRYSLNLATCYRRTGRQAEARKLTEQALAQGRTNAANIARELAEKNKDKDADEQQQAQLSASFVAGIVEIRGNLLLAGIDIDEGKADSALEKLDAVRRADPEMPALWHELARAYLRLKRWDDALAAIAKALGADPENAGFLAAKSAAHLGKREFEAAADAALGAVALLFNFPVAHYRLGVALTGLREYDRAIEAFDVVTRIQPGFIPAHRWLQRLYWLNDDEESLARSLHHRTQVARLRAARKQERDTQRESHSPDMADVLAPSGTTPDAPTFNREAGIVVVTGLPRSGTSMLMQMLDAGGISVFTDNERTADENNLTGYLEYAPVKQLGKDNSWLSEARGSAIKIVAPLLPHIDQQHDYRFIFVLRDLTEVVKSQYAMLKRDNKSGSRLSEEQLVNQYIESLGRIRAALDEKYPNQVLYLSHRHCIDRPEDAARSITEFLGIELDTANMARVVKPELYRERA